MVAGVFTAGATTYVVAATNVAVTDAATVAQYNSIDAATTGLITATISNNDIATLSTLTDNNGTGLNVLTITVTDATASAADLNTLDNKTSVAINAASITDITSSAVADVKALIAADTAGKINTDNDWTVALSDASVSVADANIVDAGTSGAITTTITEGDVTTLAILTGIDNAYAITVTDTLGVDVTGINTINAATTVQMDVTAATSFSGTAANAITMINDDAGVLTDSNYNITISDNKASLTQFNTIDSDTSGQITMGELTLDNGNATAIDLTALSSAEGLSTLNTNNDQNNAISAITEEDVLAVNSGKLIVITGNAGDTIDLTGWSHSAGGTYYTSTQGDTSYHLVVSNEIAATGAVTI